MPDAATPIILPSGHRLRRIGHAWRAETPQGETITESHARLALRALARRTEVAAHYALADEAAIHAALIADLRRREGNRFLWRRLRTRDSLLVLDEIDDAMTAYRLRAQPGGPRPYIDGSALARLLDQREPVAPDVDARADLAVRFVVACHNMTLGEPLPDDIDPALVAARPWYVTEIDRHDVVHAADGTPLFCWTHPDGVGAEDRHVAEDCVVLANAYPPTPDSLTKARAAMKQRRRALRRVELAESHET